MRPSRLLALTALLCAGLAAPVNAGVGPAPAAQTFELIVDVWGDGDGTVTSDPSGINCGAETFDCVAEFEDGTEVRLTATPSGSSVFINWEGACTGVGECEITVDADVEVQAVFDTAWIEVEPQGQGTGVVTSDPAGLACGYESSPCKASYLPGTEVALIPTPADDSVFVRWGGACTGSGACELTLDDDVDVTASFDTSYIYVKDEGDGAGVVTASVGDLSCPPTCLERYLPGTEVTLTATPEPGTAFAGWDGHCDGTGTTCFLELDSDAQVEATFDTGRVFAAVWGDGTGTVTSTPAGISCPDDCREDFLPGTQVTLVAEPTGGKSAFVGWIGDCSGTGACVLDAATDPYAQAMFDSARLTVDRVGLGVGSVTSDPAGIDCGDDCSELFAPGSTVTLTAEAEAGSTFTGWLGDCTGVGPCVLELDADTEIVAQFNPPGVAGKIAYECSGDICIMNEDGTGHTNITNTPDGDEYAPTLSPDGTRVAFITSAGLPDNPDRNLEIAVINIDGSGLFQVTHSSGEAFGERWSNYDPDWSPDGTKIAYVTNRASNPVQRQIYTINADGTGETMITDADQVTRLSPQWSPDGTKIAYTWWSGQQDVYVMDADGSNQVNVTADDGWWDEWGPAWSPDGTRIAFTTDRYYEELTHNTDIMVIQADGTGIARATDVMAIDQDPTWSPDGQWIAFSSPRGGSYDIWAVMAPPPGGAIDGVTEEGLTRLTTAPGADLDPYWSGDSSQLMHPLTVKKTGKGKGTVKSSPAGIACGRDCREVFAAGTRVVLTARAAEGSVLVGWNRPCRSSSTSTTCVVAVKDVTKIKVQFDRIPTTSPR